MLFSLIRCCVLFLVVPAALFSQTRWQTTHTESWHSAGDCRLVSNTISITVNPLSIDVEEEAIIEAAGTVFEGDANTLEIFGTFSLTKGAAIRSMLLWNGDKILKARLKDRDVADSAYEDVVDRDEVVFTSRDPAIIGYLGNSFYQFKIYPVAINNARKIRVLYTVPLKAGESGPQFEFNSIFAQGWNANSAYLAPSKVPIEIQKSPALADNYILAYNDVRKSIQFGATYEIEIQVLEYWSNNNCCSLKLIQQAFSGAQAYAKSVSAGETSGNYSAIFAKAPDTLFKMLTEIAIPSQDVTLEASVKVGENVYIADPADNNLICLYLKSVYTWDSTVVWTAYNSNGAILLTYQQKFMPKTDSASTGAIPFIWATKYSLAEGTGALGALFGFIDSKMSLIALESDTLPASEALLFAESGVPLLQPQEIITSPLSRPAAPKENIIVEFATGIATKLKKTIQAISVAILRNGRILIQMAELADMNSVKIEAVDMSGRIVASWPSVPVQNATAEVRLPAQAKGCLVLRVFTDAGLRQASVMVR